MDVFRKRAARQRRRTRQGERAQRALVEAHLRRPSFSAQDWTPATARRRIRAAMFRQGEFLAPSRVESGNLPALMQTNRATSIRHDASARAAQAKSAVAEELHVQLDDAERILLETFSVPRRSSDGNPDGRRNQDFDKGWSAGQLWRRIVHEYLHDATRRDSIGVRDASCRRISTSSSSPN